MPVSYVFPCASLPPPLGAHRSRAAPLAGRRPFVCAPRGRARWRAPSAGRRRAPPAPMCAPPSGRKPALEGRTARAAEHTHIKTKCKFVLCNPPPGSLHVSLRVAFDPGFARLAFLPLRVRRPFGRRRGRTPARTRCSAGDRSAVAEPGHARRSRGGLVPRWTHTGPRRFAPSQRAPR